MNCMKCGRDIQEEQVFCAECLADMEKYPVKPGTAVQLPHRPAAPAGRRNFTRRKPLSLEEQVKKMRKVIQRLIAALIVTILLAAAMVYPTVKYLLENQKFLIGQNYSVIQELLPSETEE